MKPDAAAQQLQQVKIEVAAAVIMRLNAAQSSLILNEMDPQKAAVIANIIASASDPNTSKDPHEQASPGRNRRRSLLAGCQSPQAINEIGRAPAMSPIGSGLAYGQTPQMSMYPKQPRQVAQGYSLWSDSQAALFKDARALNVGDILTVDIQINDKVRSTTRPTAAAPTSSGLNWDVKANLRLSAGTQGRRPT
jgi:hypothetical protein